MSIAVFRGKSSKSGKWIQGSLIELDDDFVFICPRYEEASTLSPLDLVKTLMEPVDPETIGQYTGLNDKNGNRIFEGDILLHVDYPDEPMRLVWYVNGYALKGLWMDGEWPKILSKIEVAGNIHDNPELLKEGK